MVNPIVKLYSTTAARLNDLEVNDGQLIFVKDTRRIYLDMNGLRVEYSDIRLLSFDSDRSGLLAPVEGFYYIEETNVLWRYKSKWTQISPSNLTPIVFGELETFPEVGNPTSLYVSDNVVYKWDAGLSSYLAVANNTCWENLE